MPTLLREGPYRFYVVSGDRGEPAHVHVQRDDRFAKVWLEPVELESSGRFSPAELRGILRIVARHQTELIEAWHDYFDR